MPLGRLKLRDMKRTPADKAEERVEREIMEVPDYPFGLNLHLDEDSLEKLDIELPDVGDTFFVVAVARVRSVSEHQLDADKTQHVDLQIEQLSLDAKVVKS